MSNDNFSKETRTNQLGGHPVKKKDEVISKAEVARMNSQTLATKTKAKEQMLATAAKELDKISSPGAGSTITRETTPKKTVDEGIAAEPKREVKRTVAAEPKREVKRTVAAEPKREVKRTKEAEPVDGGKKKITPIDTLRFGIGLLVNSFIVLILIQVFVFGYNFSYKVFANVSYHPKDNSEIVVTILPDSSSMEIAETLENLGVIEDKWVMLVRVRLGSYYSKLLPGTYTLSPSMTTDEILDALCGISSEESTKK